MSVKEAFVSALFTLLLQLVASDINGCSDLLIWAQNRTDVELLTACHGVLPDDACVLAQGMLGARPWALDEIFEACHALNLAWHERRPGVVMPEAVEILAAAPRLRMRQQALMARARKQQPQPVATSESFCPSGWVNLEATDGSQTCFSPPSLTSDLVTNPNCSVGDCVPVFQQCEASGAIVATKTELHLWINTGGNLPRSYGLTSTSKTEKSSWLLTKIGLEKEWSRQYFWLTAGTKDYGWYRNGCCGSDDRYFVCTKPANTGAMDAALKNKSYTDYDKVLKNPNPDYNWTLPSAAVMVNGTDTYFQNYTANINEDAA